MKTHLIVLILTFSVNLSYSQNDKFEKAILALEEINYSLTKKNSEISKFQINTSIEWCNLQEFKETRIDTLNFENVISFSYSSIKSKNEIRPKTYVTAEIMELEFINLQNAKSNEKIINQLGQTEKECINKAPWTYWRIENKLYFILTRAKLFGQEIPKIKEKMIEKLK